MKPIKMCITLSKGLNCIVKCNFPDYGENDIYVHVYCESGAASICISSKKKMKWNWKFQIKTTSGKSPKQEVTGH